MSPTQYNINVDSKILYNTLINIKWVLHVLAPCDSSQFSDKSLDYAVGLAKTIFLGKGNKQTAGIILLHVTPELPISRALFDCPIRNQPGNMVPLG